MKVLRTTPEGCLGDIALQILHRIGKDKVQKKVKTLTGIALREFVKVKVERFHKTKKGYKSLGVQDAWADFVTGTLYGMDGKCFSSSQVEIVETDEEPHCSIKDMMDKFKFGTGYDYEYG